MRGRLAIVACGGALPVQIAASMPDALLISLAGVPHDLGPGTQAHQLEKLGGLFKALKAEGVTQVVFAGSLARPALNPAEFDPVMTAFAPRLLTALQGGDDDLLGAVIEMFEDQGIKVVGAHDVLPGLTAASDLLVGVAPQSSDLADAARAWDILQALSPLDVGQGCVVEAGQCLGIETSQGTDIMLQFVAETRRPGREGRCGVFVKAAKRGQDLRIDMPSIGPETVAAVARAGLAGLVIEAARVIIVEREKTLQAIKDAGIFLAARVF